MKKNIIITILVILVLGLGGYLIYDKIIDKKQENNTNEKVQEEVKEQEFDKEEAKNLVSKYTVLFKNHFYNPGGNTITTLSEQDKLIMSLKTIYNSIQNKNEIISYENINCDKIPGVEIVGNVELNGCSISDKYAFDYNTIAISYDELNKIYKQLFGEENNVSKISTNNAYGYYDQSTDKYYIGAVSRCAGGIYSHCGAGPVGNEWSVKSATIKNDILTVDIEVVKSEKADIYRWVFQHENYRFVLQTMNML